MGIRDENLFSLIDNTSDFLNNILFLNFEVDVKNYENFKELIDLKIKLKEYIKLKEFKKGQDFIFNEIYNLDAARRHFARDLLRVAYWFFLELNSLSEEELKNGGFEKIDIMLGMEKIENIVIGKE